MATSNSLLLQARGLAKSFTLPDGGKIRALDGVSFELNAGETLAVVGESGSGKTTLARSLVRIESLDAGEITFLGADWLRARGGALRRLRREMQMVFQDPYGSLDPLQRVDSTIAEPLAIHEPSLRGEVRAARILETLEAVGLGREALSRYPHEFSGGQRQRLAIARALVLRPQFVVADEPVSALDPSIGAQILDLLERLQRQFGLTYLLVSHSFPVVAQLATRIAVMRQGQIVEIGPAADVLQRPAHPYTQSLVAAAPALPVAPGRFLGA